MYRTVRTWIRGHPRLVDAVPAAALVLLTTLGVSSVPYDPVWWVALLVAGGQCGPVLIRRGRPMTAFVLAALVACAQWLLNIGLVPANLALFAALYNVASRRSWQQAAFAAGVLELGAVLVKVRWFPAGGWIDGLIPATILITAIWIWGNSVRIRRAYLASLQERAVRLERERDQQEQIAAADERARIAREMHDVVSHSLGIMIAQADGAAYTADADPTRAQGAMQTVATTGRTALTEMRRMLGVLRNGQPDDEYTPQPGIAQLEQLVQQMRQAGLPVDYTVNGTPQQLPAGVELAAYRVAQEALTNTLKHAGPSVSQTQLRLQYGEEMLTMQICDDGRGAAAAPAGSPSAGHESDLQQHGHGLIGMRERVAAYGGSLHSGPATGGGFEVVASLPLPGHNREHQPSTGHRRPGCEEAP